MEKSTAMALYEGGDWRITDIHVGRIRVAKLTLMGIYEGWKGRAYFEVVTETTTVFCRVRRQLENSVLPVGACAMSVFIGASSGREGLQRREIKHTVHGARRKVLVDETRGGDCKLPTDFLRNK